MEDDIDMHTNPATGETARHNYLYHSITKDQAEHLLALIKGKKGHYNLLFNNCA